MSNANSNQPRSTSANKMLIDATHPEETRVVVLRNGRVEEFDYESAARKLLRGNIYLAKVTRVEPSLQAAFVDYGGNRHGFLAFNEIHPDYYQIPIADRRALIEAEAAAEAEEEAAADRAAEAAAARRARRRGPADAAVEEITVEEVEDNAVEVASLLPPEEPGGESTTRDHRPDELDPRVVDDEGPSRALAERAVAEAVVAEPWPTSEPASKAEPSEQPEVAIPFETDGPERSQPAEALPGHAPGLDEAPMGHGPGEDSGDILPPAAGQVETVDAGNGADAEQIETVATDEDVLEEVPTRPRRRLRSYKIQEVTKRRQVLLVQVVKEERGTKGAALTTYLSLAGRYTVLMPNTARGGGISRKITNPQDRKRLKAIAAELDVPEGMGLIIRTAGAARTKQEIKRDYEYLLRLWESVRELALGSNAPALVYEEGNLIKRSIRDLYGKEVEEIVVAGELAYREAKDFMRMLMPSHAKNVLYYQDAEQLFSRYQIERQLNAMFSPYVHLRSGGYLVINQTEALVAIDINSGKSTREFSIEETALSTNMEAADELARQLKLRDLAGLIVIDFIDMEEKRNNRAVERRLKDALRHDRARIQLGRISHFGLLEMSRQRMRTGVLEGSTIQCPHCQGTGIIRSTESVALAVLRGLEDALMSGQPSSLTATTTAAVALYILNNKRPFIVDMERRYGISIQVQASERVQGANFTIDRQARREEPQRRPDRAAVNMDWGFEDDDPEAAGDSGSERGEEVSPAAAEGRGRYVGEGGDAGDGRRRRRRRRRGRRGEPGGEPVHSSGQPPEPYADEGGPDVAGIEAEEGSAYADDRGHPRSYVEDGRPRNDSDDRGAADRGAYNGGAAEDLETESEAGDGERPGRRRRRGRRGGRRIHDRDRPAAPAGVTEGYELAGGHPNGDGEAATDESEPSDARDDRRSASTPVDIAESPRVNSEPQPDLASAKVAAPPVAVAPTVHGSATNGVIADPHSAHAQAAAQVAPDERAGSAPSEPPSRYRTAPVASEPVLERVVVGPDAAAVQPSEEAARPSRRGWWQRK